MKNKTLILTLICIFLINVSASYAYTENDFEMDKISTDTEKLSENDYFPMNTENSLECNTVKENILTTWKIDKPKNLYQTDIIIAAHKVDEFISNKKKLPNYVTISGYKFSMPEFMYLLAKTVEYRIEKQNSNIMVKYHIKNPSRPKGVDVKGHISKKDYHNYAKRVANFISLKNAAPNYVTSQFGYLQYQSTIYLFIKILQKKNLPKKISFKMKKSDAINKFMPYYKSEDIHVERGEEPIEQYLQETKNCEVNDETIKSLAISLTSKLTSTLQKAEAIFNYVNYYTEYSYYYNTLNGAKNTLAKKKGNCVDKTHLMIALCRAVKIPARYVHGTCHFISGRTCGHVWSQILIEDTWIAADPTNSKVNRFGVINNWKTDSYVLKGVYNEIKF